jgi:hypothetical protein
VQKSISSITKSLMRKFRKKPIVIEASQWFKDGDHPDVTPMPMPFHKIPNCKQCGKSVVEHGHIDTLEGGFIVCPGDWIIKGIKGEMYNCKPDIFEATYEPI